MRYGTIATGEETTSLAASGILETGGNAFDAAVGAVFTSMTSEYTLTGACGGGAFLALPCGKKPLLFDFFVDTPHLQSGIELDFFKVTVNFGPSTQDFHIGRGSVAVPGNIAGLLHVHEKLGRLPLKTVLEPAVECARNGSTINKAHAYLFKILDPIISYTQAGKNLFQPNGSILKTGDIFRNPDFADFLEEIIAEGADCLYKGECAKEFSNMVGKQGLITEKMLASYRVIERKPLSFRFAGKFLYTNPAPSTGGSLIAFILQMLENNEIGGNISTLNLIKAMHTANLARSEVNINTKSEFQIGKILEKDSLNRWTNNYHNFSLERYRGKEPPSPGATTQVSIIDCEGNAASVTTTNGEGCGYLIPGTGIMPNNMLGEEDLNPMGFHKWTKRQRLPTMMSPTIIVGDSGPEMVLGSGGSNRIRSAISQVIINVLTKGMNLTEAVSAPRLHLEGNMLHCEKGIPHMEKVNLPGWLSKHEWDEQNLFFGGVNAVTPTEAIGDPRRGGSGIIC